MKPDTVTFLSTSNRLNETVMVAAESTHLPDVIEVFERFLRGAGYVFEGHLEVVVDTPFPRIDDPHFKPF
jgi:hypothetical protein